ncbi:hypothetical protein [Devosia sp.]|uniref:hypothetical protein n=1 Tax=Devosia sp. TaxID=1871048 RepID=UPI0025D891BF|nr:hypothetical protein [Devosia sp.]MCR6633483.1 hypothetical protein [Devosia sp.]
MTEIGSLAGRLTDATKRLATIIGLSEAGIVNAANQVQVVTAPVSQSEHLIKYLRARVVLLAALPHRTARDDAKLNDEIDAIDGLQSAF